MKRFHLFPIIVGALLLIYSCQPEEQETIMTVNGPINSSELGITLAHEHVLVDFIGADSTGYHRWDKDEVVRVVTPYIKELQDQNVQTMIECTPAYIGRDPEMLKKLSTLTGLQLITNTGFYGANNNKYVPAFVRDISPKDLADIWIDEFKNGIEGSGVRPGFIKIAVDRNDTLSPEHEKIITAAAMAHRKTGLVIASHTGPEKPAFAQIKILASYGIKPSAFIWVHAQRGTLESNIKAAKSGAWVSLDNVNDKRQSGTNFSIEWYIDRLTAFKEAGLLNRVLISHDAGWYSPGEKDGGNFRGYSAIFTTLLPELKNAGFTQDELDQLMVLNPREAFTIRRPA